MDSSNIKQFNKNTKTRAMTRGQTSSQTEQHSGTQSTETVSGQESSSRVEENGEEGSQIDTIKQDRQGLTTEGDGEGDDGKDGEGEGGSEGEAGNDARKEGIINIPVENPDEDEHPEILRRHNMWMNNMRTAFIKNEAVKFEMLRNEYTRWCVAQGTDERDPMLFDFQFGDDQPAPVVSDTCSKPVNEVAARAKARIGSRISSGAFLTHNLPALSKHFDAIMRTRDSHMTVAIFSEAWILEDQAWMTKKKVPKMTCASESVPYVGLKYPHEWRLDLAEWMIRFDLMVLYHREIYDKLEGQDPIADRLEAHKRIVLKIKTEQHGAWPPAYRYDIANRRSVWEHRLADGTMADIGQRNEDVLKQALSDSEFFKDNLYPNNPYVIGGSLQHKSPIDGKMYSASASWDSPAAIVASDALATSTAGRMLPYLAVSTSSFNEYNGQTYKQNNQYGPYNRNQNKRNGGTYHGGNGGFNNNTYNYGGGGWGSSGSYGNGNGGYGNGGGGSGGFPGNGRGNGGGGRGRGNSNATWKPRPGIGAGSFDKAKADAEYKKAVKATPK